MGALRRGAAEAFSDHAARFYLGTAATRRARSCSRGKTSRIATRPRRARSSSIAALAADDPAAACAVVEPLLDAPQRRRRGSRPGGRFRAAADGDPTPRAARRKDPRHTGPYIVCDAGYVPLPYPHRATFLASTLVVPLEQSRHDRVPRAVDVGRRCSISSCAIRSSRSATTTSGSPTTDGRLLDAAHPQIEDTIDWLFRDRAPPRGAVVRARHRPRTARRRRCTARAAGRAVPTEEWTASREPAAVAPARAVPRASGWPRALPAVAPLPEFSVEDLRNAGDRLANADAMLSLRGDLTANCRRACSSRCRGSRSRTCACSPRSPATRARTLDPKILELDPTHPVARRNAYVAGLIQGETDRRDILPLVAEAPMYGKPHLSIWGEPFANDRPLENMGVRHQGIAASLMPANPYACHNYSLQLAEVGPARGELSLGRSRDGRRARSSAPRTSTACAGCARSAGPARRSPKRSIAAARSSIARPPASCRETTGRRRITPRC